jgi:hypothetical protein
MVEPVPRFDVTGDMRVERLTFWADPVNNHTFHPFGVIDTSTISTFLDLLLFDARCTREELTYKIHNLNHFIFR